MTGEKGIDFFPGFIILIHEKDHMSAHHYPFAGLFGDQGTAGDQGM
jgi:hypothetical protein